MDGAFLQQLVDRAEEMLARIGRDGKRVDELAQRLRDEAWHAGVDRAAPDDEDEKEHRRRAADLTRSVERELSRLRALVGTATERTGT